MLANAFALVITSANRRIETSFAATSITAVPAPYLVLGESLYRLLCTAFCARLQVAYAGYGIGADSFCAGAFLGATFLAVFLAGFGSFFGKPIAIPLSPSQYDGECLHQQQARHLR